MKKFIPKKSDALAALRLIRSEGVGPTTFARLAHMFGGIDNALNAMPNMRKPLTPANLSSVQNEHEALLKLGGHWLIKENDDYPELLKPIDDAPPVLSALGDLSLLQKPMIGIVGARNASVNGRKIAANIARDLGQAGYVIVSGLARGIDASVHEAALETGTIAVVANGVDVVYPPENKKLYDALGTCGLILSENPLGAQPAMSLFPRRNRIISGLSKAVIIIEAAAKSGSLITANFALDQGRDVFAVPGNPLDPRAAGPNHLIKSGQAQLIESAEDVLNALGTLHLMPRETTHKKADDSPSPSSALQSVTNDQAKQSVLMCLSPTPCSIDQIIHATELPTSQLLSILMELELSGIIQRLSGDRVSLV